MDTLNTLLAIATNDAGNLALAALATPFIVYIPACIIHSIYLNAKGGRNE